MRRRRWVLAALLAALVLPVAACGGGDDDASGDGTTAAATETTGGGNEAGAEVFASAGCGGCHTLAAAGSNGTTGPNLDEAQPDQATVEEQVRNGGGGMPAFEGRLSDQEIQDVAAYVAESAGS